MIIISMDHILLYSTNLLTITYLIHGIPNYIPTLGLVARWCELFSEVARLKFGTLKIN